MARVPVHDRLPSIYRDRMPVAELRLKNPRLLEAMAAWNIGKVGIKEQIHFCGMVRMEDGQSAVFLPRGMSHCINSAAKTMAALAQFGRDASNRDFSSDGDVGNSGLLAVISKLATDFRENGLFRERQRVRAQNVGKPDWKRTVSRERSFVLEGVGDIFPDISTTRTIDSNDTLLAQIQTVVIEEILAEHGWWLGHSSSRKAELRWCQRPKQLRSMWPKLLDGLLPRLYSRRAIFLAKMLAFYLRGRRDSDVGSFVFGLEDFHAVWEVMLRQSLVGVEDGWNERLPKAIYIAKAGGNAEAPERGMLTDIILHDPAGYTIVDAKYYSATSAATVPGWPDIAKQMFYEMALKAVVGEEVKLRNCFVFPSSDGDGPYSAVEMRMREGKKVETFPSIETIYMGMELVMDTYLGVSAGSRLRLPSSASPR